MIEELHESVLRFAPWSISKAGSLQRCQRQYERKYVLKLAEGPSPKSGRTGTAVHYVLERGLLDDNDSPESMKANLEHIANEKKLLVNEVLDAEVFLPYCGDFIRRIRAFKLKFGVKQLLVEHKLSISPEFGPLQFFDKGGLLRGVIDLALITGDNMLIVVDHKTGKPKPITFHYEQMYSYALMGVAHFPVRAVQGTIHYVGETELSRMNGMTRDYIDSELRPWLVKYLNRLVEKIALVEAGNPPHNTGWMCEWCPYVFEPECPEGKAHVQRKGHVYKPSPIVNL
jgi:RecB family exonuclease